MGGDSIVFAQFLENEVALEHDFANALHLHEFNLSPDRLRVYSRDLAGQTRAESFWKDVHKTILISDGGLHLKLCCIPWAFEPPRISQNCLAFNVISQFV